MTQNLNNLKQRGDGDENIIIEIKNRSVEST
jgi:hypothetical protein